MIFLQSCFILKNIYITNYFKYSHTLVYMSFLFLIWYYGYRLVSSGWLLCKPYAHTLVGVSWHTCICIFVCIHPVSIEICQINYFEVEKKLNLNKCRNIVNWTLRVQWNFNKNSHVFIQEITFENVICEMAGMLSRPQCVKEKVILVAWLITYRNYGSHSGHRLNSALGWLQRITWY